jgi:hypothetical protein
MDQQPAKKLPRTPEAIRDFVLKDPNVAGIAENLGVTLEEYVDHVIYFVMHPEDGAEVYIAPDEEILKMGLTVPDPIAMNKYIIDALRINGALVDTAFETAKKAPVALTNDQPAPALEGDASLKADLARQMSDISRRGKS